MAISDTHGQHRRLKLPKADFLVHCGDVGMSGNKTEVMDFIDWFSALKFKYKIFVAGNHDFYLERLGTAAVQALLPENVWYLNDMGVDIEGLRIWGSPYTPFYQRWAFTRFRGPQIAAHWAKIPPGTDLLITHGPAYKTLDLHRNELHIGCKDLAQRMEIIKPKMHLFGHVHESYGSRAQSGTRYINCSMLDEDYRMVNPPVQTKL